jgi:hypothetical protein
MLKMIKPLKEKGNAVMSSKVVGYFGAAGGIAGALILLTPGLNLIAGTAIALGITT